MVSNLEAFTICNRGTQHKAQKQKTDRAIQKKVSSKLKLGCFFGKVIIEVYLEGCSLVFSGMGEGVQAGSEIGLKSLISFSGQ